MILFVQIEKKMKSCLFIFTILLVSLCFADRVSYDFVIAGSGSGGSQVAAELAKAGFDVALFEVGMDGTNDTITKITEGAYQVVPWMTNNIGFRAPFSNTQLRTFVYHSSEYNLLRTTITTLCSASAGGGPSISGANIGHPSSDLYNKWATQLNDSSFNALNMIAIRKTLENVAYADSPSPVRGRNGSMEVYFHSNNDTTAVLAQSFAAFMNLTYQQDYAVDNGDPLVGFFPMQRSLKRSSCTYHSGNCERQSPFHNEIEPLIASGSIDYYPQHTVMKIVTQTKPNGKIKVKGFSVRNATSGNCDEIYATKGVILSAGSYGSPQILLRSGIGPAEDLNAIGIHVVKNISGIGKNLQDHTYTPIVYWDQAGTTISSPYSVQVAQWISGLNGPNTTDLEVSFQIVPASYFNLPFGNCIVFVQTQVYNTTAGGFLKLKSAGNSVPPEIQFNFDLQRLAPHIWSFRKIRSFMATLGEFVIEISPGLGTVPSTATDSDLTKYFGTVIEGYYHMQSTVCMGPDSDPSCPLNTKFQLKEIPSIYVCDLSATPKNQLITAHPSGAAKTFGAKCARGIINDYVDTYDE